MAGNAQPYIDPFYNRKLDSYYGKGAGTVNPYYNSYYGVYMNYTWDTYFLSYFGLKYYKQETCGGYIYMDPFYDSSEDP